VRRRRINRRPELIPDDGKPLPQFAFELRQADPQAERVADGGLLFPEPCCIEAAGALRHDAGKPRRTPMPAAMLPIHQKTPENSKRSKFSIANGLRL